MKILYFNNALAIHGGLERILIDKMNWLAAQSDNYVYVLTTDQGNHPIVFPLHPKIVHVDLGIQFHEQYKFTGLKRWRCGRKLHQVFLSRLSKKIIEISPDIVVCAQKQFLGDILKANGTTPVVFECHSACLSDKFENYGFWQRLQNWRYNRNVRYTQNVVALTEGDAAEWRRFSSQVEVIPNMVHLNETGRVSDCVSKKVIFVGRYTTQKDIGSLLQIWNLVHLRHPDWQLHLYGGYGNQPGKWEQEIERLDCNIIAHGPTSNIFDRYQESSMLLLTSVHEPFGLVLPEAMSCGLPVVSFDCPYGPADIITDGVDGFLIKGRSISFFADRVCALIESEELRKQMGEAAIKSAQRYKADIIMPRWIRLFEKIVANSN